MKNHLTEILPGEKVFLDLTPEQQIDQCEYDLTEIKLFYGSWDKVREVIKMLEDNEQEAAFDRHNNKQ